MDLATERAPRPVCMLVHAYYEEDSRVRRQAETLVAQGRPVDVFALRRPGDPPAGVVEGVRVHRLPVQRHQGAGLGTYLAEYLAFAVRAGWGALRAHRRRRYALVQVHTMPDFLAFAVLPLRLAGVPVLLDLHEAMPEFFRMRFPGATNPIAHRILRLQELLATRVADAVMTVNDALGDRLIGLGVPPGKLTIVINSPSTARFHPAAHPERPFMADGTLRLAYAGALTPTYELELVLDAVARLAVDRPDLPVVVELYGRGDADAPLRAHAQARGISERVRFHGRIPLEDVPGAIAAADIGLAPTRRTAFTDFSLSTKIFEYAAMGKPVVASNLPTVGRYFGPDALAVYEPGDEAELVRVLMRLVDDPAWRADRIARTAVRLAELSWDREAERYSGLVDRLAGRLGAPAIARS